MPAPGVTPPACEAAHTDCAPSSGGIGDLFDLPGMVVDAVTSLLGTLIEQIAKPVRALLAATLLATPDVTRQADVKRLWTAMLGITAGIYVLFVTAGGITVMGYETVQTRYAVKQIVPRLVFGMVAAATSLTVMGKAIGLSNALAHAIMATDASDAGQGLVERILPFALFGASGIQVYLLLLAIAMVALVIAVLIGFLVRVAVMALLAVAAPLALACHGHPLTDPVARLWWRALAGALVIQVAQSMTFILALKLFFAPGGAVLGVPKPNQLGTMLAGLALFWVLFKIPGWTLQTVLRGTAMHHPHAPTGVRFLKHLAMYRLLDRYLPGMSLLRRPGGGAGSGFGRGGPGGRGSPGGRGGGPGSRGGPASGGAGPAGTGAQERPRASRGRPGGRTAHPRSSPTPSTQLPRGPRTVIHPSQARRIRQLALPIPTPGKAPRPARPTQLWLPISAERVPVSPQPPAPRTTPAPALPPSRPTPGLRARQLALPLPVARVRVRPPRPMQLRLPLEPPRR